LDVLVNCRQVVCAHHPLTNALLIGDDHDVWGPFTQRDQGEPRPRQPFKVFPVPHVVANDPPVHDTISVHEETPFTAGSLRHEFSDG
jgi:hypothetical protein